MTNHDMISSTAPTLASSLFDRELKHHEQSTKFATGIKDVDQKLSLELWTGGKIIGVVSEGEVSLPAQIISEHLLSVLDPNAPNQQGGHGFIVAPHHSTIISSLHATTAARLLDLPAMIARLPAAQYLEEVQLLQYFDFAGLTESVGEVSARLFDMEATSPSTKSILYLEGIGVAIAQSQRRSGIVQATALLSSLLRVLVHLSRTYSSLLILLDLRLRKDSTADEVIPSAFASASAIDMVYQPGGAVGRILERTLDVAVLVHDAHGTATNGTMVVEVVKDRVGDTLGQWAVWQTR